MKNLLYISLVTFLFVACSSGNSGDKKVRLAELKKHESALRDSISQLEEEIAKSDTSKDSKGREVAITKMVTSEFQHLIAVQAKVDGDENVMVSPDMPGTITHVYVRAGEKVAKGALLVELDNAVYKKSLDELQSGREFANTIYLKQKNLWDQRIGSEVQYLTAKNNLESLDKKIATVREQLELTKVKSPIDGTVDVADIKAGQLFAPGMQGLRVVNFESLKVKAEVAEAYIAKVKTGDAVEIQFPDLNKSIKANLTYSGKVIDPVNRTFGVQVSVSNKDVDLHPNMVAVLLIADYRAKDAFALPVNVIQTTPNGSYVFIAEGNKAVKRDVTIGQLYNGMQEITSGLKVGEQVITTGFQDLADGQFIQY